MIEDISPAALSPDEDVEIEWIPRTPLDRALKDLTQTVQQQANDGEKRSRIHRAVIRSNETSDPTVWKELQTRKSNGCLVGVGCAASLAFLDAEYWESGEPQFVLLFDRDPIVAGAATALIAALAEKNTFDQFALFMQNAFLDALTPLPQLYGNVASGMTAAQPPIIDVWSVIQKNYEMLHHLAGSEKIISVCASIDDPHLAEMLLQHVPNFAELRNLVYASNVIDYYMDTRGDVNQPFKSYQQKIVDYNTALAKLAGGAQSTLLHSRRLQFYWLEVISPPLVDAVPADFTIALSHLDHELKNLFTLPMGIDANENQHPYALQVIKNAAKRLAENIMGNTADDLQIDVVNPLFGIMSARAWITSRYGKKFAEVVEDVWPVVQSERKEFEEMMKVERKSMRKAD